MSLLKEYAVEIMQRGHNASVHFCTVCASKYYRAPTEGGGQILTFWADNEGVDEMLGEVFISAQDSAFVTWKAL